MISKRLESPGSWMRMSADPTKIDSSACHFFWTSIHVISTASTAPRRRCHSDTFSKKKSFAYGWIQTLTYWYLSCHKKDELCNELRIAHLAFKNIFKSMQSAWTCAKFCILERICWCSCFAIRGCQPPEFQLWSHRPQALPPPTPAHANWPWPILTLIVNTMYSHPTPAVNDNVN